MFPDHDSASLPPALQQLVENELEFDETLHWVGQPIPIFFTEISLHTFLFAFPWTFLTIILVYVFGQEPTFLLIGAPLFVLFGLIMFCAPLLVWWSLKKTVYAITDKRAMIFVGFGFWTKIVSFEPSELRKIRCKEKSDGIGDIIFYDSPHQTEQVHKTQDLTGYVTAKGFLNIPHAKEVERLLNNLAGAVPQEELPRHKDMLAALPILQHISSALRHLPLSVRLYLRMCSGYAPFAGWVFGGFGFMFALIAAGVMGLDDAIPRTWGDAGKATITNVQATNFSIGGGEHGDGIKVYAYHFEAADDEGKIISGISYGFGGKYKVGDETSIQKSENRYRVHNLALAKGGAGGENFPLIFFGAGCLFGFVGLCSSIYAWLAMGKAIYLLRDGEATGARYVGMNSTGVSDGEESNEKREMKVDFEYQVEGEKYIASVKVWNTDTSRLTEDKYKVVFYDPMQPSKSVVLEGLPKGIHFDETTGQFWTNPLRCVIPLVMATIVCGEIAAIVVLVILAI